MNICITGALGHIGSRLIRNLSIPLLNKVYLVDNLFTQRYASLFDLPPGVNCHFREMDILADGMAGIIEDSDIVVHLAAIADAETSFQNSELVERVNKKGLENIAGLCARYGRSLIFPSTTSVYGSQSDLVDENCPDSDLQPQSPYAESKLYGEKVLRSRGEKDGLKFVTFRLGTIFGYSIGMRFHTAVNKFIWQAATGQDITVWRTALRQKRPYCGLGDCINAVNHFINQRIFDCRIYNIVTVNLTVEDILNAIKECVPEIKIKFVDSPIMNQLSYNVSNKKSLERGVSYQADLKDAIRESISKLRNVNCTVVKQNL